MKTSVIEIVMGAVLIALVGVGFYLGTKLPRNTEVRYNCELAEISPDFPAEVKQKCRELKAKR